MRDTDRLLTQVLDLPKSERAEMAARVLESLDAPADDDVDQAWADEIERRCAAVDSGEIVTSDWNDVRRRIEKDLFGR
jgi:putative addiction module component (TIGR02574 family)